MPKQFLSINEAAAHLGISPKTLRRWEEQGIISPKRTIGNQRRYALSDLTSVGNKTLTIHQAATQLGVSAKTLRRWEEKGLLIPERTSGNQRRYSQHAINKLGMQQYPSAPKRKAKNDPLPTPSFIPLHPTSPKASRDFAGQVPLHASVIARSETKHLTNVKNQTDTPRQFKFSNLPSLPREALAKWGRPNKYLTYGFASLCLMIISTGLFLRFGDSRTILSQLFTNEQKNQTHNQVLQASTKQTDFALRVSVNADFLKNASVSGILTAPNITYRVIAGDNITVTGDPQNPVISAVVEDLEAFGLIAGDGIAIDGTTITNTAPGTDQNIFGNIKVGSTTISAGSNTDTFELAAGSNISLTTDSGNKKITIAADVPTPDSGIDGIEVLEGGTSVSDTITALDFLGGDFDVGESPTGEANIQLASTLTSVTGVAGSFTVANDLAVTGNVDIDGTFTLGSDTVNDLTGVGLTVSGSTLQVNLTTLGGAGSLSSNSGLEVGANGLTLLKGCSDTQVLKWDDTNTVWQCANDTGGGGVVGGTGAANQIAFWTDPSTISGNNDFYWNNTTERLGIGTNGAPLTTFDLRGNTSHLAAASLSANTSAATLIVDNTTGALFTASSSGLTRFTIAQNGDVTSSGNLAIDGSLSNLSGSTLTINDALAVLGGISLTGAISDSDSALLLDDETNIGSLANGINIATNGVISDNDGNVNINDNTDIAGDLDLSGSLTSGNSNAFQVDANGNISSTGTTGITLSGDDAGFTFSGNNNHLISASSGTLQLGATTLTGAITGGGQNITNLGQLTIDNLELNGNTLSSTASDLILDSFSGTIQLADLTTNGVVYTSGGNGTLNTEALLNVARGGTGVNASSASNGQLLIGNGAGFSLANLSAGSGITISNGAGSIQISQTGSGASKWTQLDASGILYPNISTLDLLVGGVSSETAKFAFLNNAGGTPTASIGGTISLTGNGELRTTNNQTLTLGGDATGNIILSPRNGSGDVRINGTTTLNGLTYTWPGSQGSNYVLQTDGNGTLTWMDPGTLPTANYWVQGNGILYPKIADVFDFLLGGESTTSAEFAITGINNGTPVATLSAIANNTGLSLNASSGTLQSLNYGTLTLGGDTTGNISIAPKAGTGTLALNAGELTINGTPGETSVSPTCVSVTNGIVTGLGGCGAGSGGSVWTLNTTDGTLYPINNTMDLLFGGASTASAKFAFLNIAGGSPTASLSAITTDNALTLDATGTIGTTNKQTLTLGTASTGDINLVIGGSNELRINGTAGADVGTATCVIASNGIVTGTGSCDTPLSSFIWSTSSDGGAIIEGNTTRDLLIGGEATTSAKFAVLNVNSGTPTATLSGQTGGTYLTANGELRTENNQSLTLGGTGTGNIVLDSGNNVIRLADLATNGVVYTSGGNGTLNTETLLDVSRGGTGINGASATDGQLLIGNDSGNGFTLANLTEGAGITITNGAGAITIAQNAVRLSKWTQNATDGTLYPTISTLDLLVGGVATNSAKFAFINSAGGVPTASISAIATNNALILDAAGNIATTNKQTLTLGTTNTGNILIGSDATARDITIGSSSTTGLSLTDDNWSVTNAGLATFTQANVDNLQLDGNTLQTNSGNLILDSAGSTLLSDLSTDGVVFTSNGDGTLSTEATLSVSRGGIGMDATTVTNGQILIGNDTNNDFDLATLTPGAGIQITNAAGSITIAQTETGGSKWTQSDANGTLYPNISTLDLLVGGVATNSAKFAVLNVSGGTPTASVSGTAGGAYLTANGILSTTNKQTLTLGDFTNTGNINVISESNNGRIDNYFGLFSPIGFTVNQTVVGERLSISGYGQVGINLLNSTTNPHLAALDLRAPTGLFGGTQPVASISGRTSFAGLVVDNSVGDIFTASSSGLPRFTIHQNGTISAPNYAGNNAILYAAPTTGQLTALTTNSSTLCLVSGTSTPSWTSCTGAGSNWDVTNGVLTPKLASTLDLLIGGTTSSSARFHAFSSLNAGTTPAASVSANSNSFAGLVVDNRGNGDIFTASRGGQTLFTIGSDRVQIGTGSATGAGGAQTPQLLGLDSKGSTGDPVHGRQGDMYYNTVDEKFRCYQGTGWRDCIAISQSEYLRAERISAQLSPELDVNDHIYFNVASSSAGSSISLNTSSYGNGGGQITLKAGRTYRLYSDINQRTIFGSNTSALVYGWYNVTSGAYIAGSSGSVVPVDVNFGDSRNQGSPAEAIFTPSVDTTVEVRIRDLNGGSLTSIGYHTLNLYPYSFVEVISGAQELSASEYFRAEMRTNQVSNVSNDDHIKFDTRDASSGTSISLDTATTYTNGAGASVGRFTLAAGKTYILRGIVPEIGYTNSAGFANFRWYNVTSSSFIGTTATYTPTSFTTANRSLESYAEAIITTSASTLVELRMESISGVDTTPGTGIGSQATARYPNAFIEVLSDGTKVAQFTGATSAADGAIGYVPAPLAGQEGSLLLGNGTWTAATNVKIGTTLTQPIASLSARTSFAGLVVDNQLGDLFAASSSGMSRFVIGQNGSITTNGVAGITSSNPICVTTTNGIVTGTGACTGGTGGSNWTLDTSFGVIRPNNSTLDLLIGGASSASAKFHVYGTTNNNGIQPVASVSGNTAQAAFIVDNRVGDLFTASSSGLNRFVIKNNGQIGIGTAVPSANRDLEIASANTFTYAKFNPTTNEDWTIGAEALGFIFFNDTDGQYRMVLDEEGNVGIGDTDPTVGSFARGLEISADGAGAALALTANAGRKFIIGSADTPAGLYFRDETAGAYRMVIDANGKIGINTGTTNVLGTLDLRGNTAHQPIASLSGSTSFAGLTIDNTTGDLFSASSSGTNRFVIKQNGNVGIGTTLPTAQLHLANPNSGGTNSLQMYVSNNGSPRIDSSGTSLLLNFGNGQNVVIGGAGAFGGADATLQHYGDNIFFRNTNSATALAVYDNISNLRFNIGTTHTMPVASVGAQSTFAGMVVDNSGTGDLFSASSSGLNRFVINQAGNVGIGTTNPLAKLHINTNTPAGGVSQAGIEVNVLSNNPIISTNSASAQQVLNNQAPSGSVTLMGNFQGGNYLVGQYSNSLGSFNGITTRSYDTYFGTFYDNWANPDDAPTSGSYINARSNEFMDFMVGGTTPQMRFDGFGLAINANGSVGYANSNLEVLGITTAGINQGFVASISGRTGKATLLVDNLSTVGDLFTASAAGLTRFVIKHNGNVGIGTSLPAQKLAVRGSDSTTHGFGAAIGLTNTAAGGASWYFRAGATGNDTPAGGFSIADDFGYRFVIESSGNIGIANNNPDNTLDVTGTIEASSDILVAGTSVCLESGTNCPGSVTNYWNRTNGALYPAITSTDFLLGGTSSTSANFRVAGDPGDALIPTVDIIKTANALTAGASNLALRLDKNSDTTGEGIGIGFTASTDNANVGAKIVHIRTGTTSQGDLAFYAKGDNASASDTTRQTLRLSATGTSPIATFSGTTSFAGMIVDNSGRGDLFTASSSGLTRFVITQNGNVGIGSDRPVSARFEVEGNIDGGQVARFVNDVAGESDGLSIYGYTSAYSGNSYQPDTGMLYAGNATQNLQLTAAHASGVIKFHTAGFSNSTTERMRIDANGNIGITATTPLATLDVRSSLVNGGTRAVASVSGRTSFAGLVVDNSGSGDIFTASSSGLTRFTITQAGHVLPGTDNLSDLGSSPSARFRSLYLGPGSLHVQCRTGDGCLQNTDYAFGINTTTGDLEIGVNGNSNNSNAKLLIGQSGLTTIAGNLNVTGTFTAGTGTLSNWNTTNGALSPKITSQDLLIGGTSSSSALFRVTGNSPFAGTTSVASVAANTSFAGLVVDNRGRGDLFTASSSGLTRFTIKQNGTIQLATSEYNTCTSLTTVNGLVTCSTSGTGVSTTYGTRGVAAGGTVSTTSSSYSNMSTNSSVSFTKQSSTSKLLIVVNTTAFNDIATGTTLGLGVNIDSTDYDCTSFSFSNVLVHASISCSIVISDITAGAKTAQMRWKRVSGTGTLYQDPGDYNSITVTELEAGTDSSLFQLTSGAIVQKNITQDLLIGGVSSSSARFHVYGSANLAGTTPVASISGNTSFAGLITDNRVGDLFTASSSGLTRFVIKNNGNVGIGTNNPEVLLEVAGRGSSTDAGSIALFGTQGSVTAGNLYGISIDKSGTDSLFLGINKNSTTGTVPANSAYISTYLSNTTLSLGRGNDAGSLGTADLFIDGSGRVGINTTSPLATLDVRRNVGTQPTASFSGRTSFAGLVVDNSLGDLFTASSSGLTRFTINNNGDVNIGTTASTGNTQLTINSQRNASIFLNGDTDNDGGELGTAFIELSQDNSNNHRYIGTVQATDQDPEGGTFTGATANALLIGNTGSDVLQFGTNANVSMTIATDGNVGIGTTSTAGYIFQAHQSDSTGLIGRFYNTANSNDADVLSLEVAYTGTAGTSNNFLNLTANGSLIGQIEGNGAGGVQYTETSDQRLKENIRDTHYSLDDLMQIKVRDYNFITAGVNTTGFLAQELYTIFPEAVSVGSDDLSEPWGVDYGKLTPLIIKGVQDQQGQIEALKDQVDSMIAGSLDTETLTVNNLSTQSLSLGGTNLNDRLLGLESGFASTSANFTSTLQTQITSLSDRVASLEARLDLLTASGSGNFNFNNFTASSGAELALDSLEVNGNILTDSLNVLGYTTINELSVTGSIRTGVLTINGQTSGGASISTLNGDLKLQDQGFGGIDILDGLVLIDTEGNIETQGTITAKKINIDTTDTLSSSAGTGTVPAGTKTTIIYTTAVTQDSLIQITFTSDYAPATRYWIKSKVAGDSFTVELNQPVTANAKFSWWIVN